MGSTENWRTEHNMAERSPALRCFPDDEHKRSILPKEVQD